MKKSKVVLFMIALLMLLLVPGQKSEAGKVKLSKKSIFLNVNEFTILSAENAGKTVKWTTDSPCISLINKKKFVKLKGVQPGKAVVKAVIGKKTLRCVVTVTDVPFDQVAPKSQCGYNTMMQYVEWSRVPGAKGYIIEKENAKGEYKFFAKVKGEYNTCYLDKANKNAAHYKAYRVRAYKIINGKTVYTQWTPEGNYILE